MRWSRFFRRKHWDAERARELEAYLETETDENVARGMSSEQARQAARRKLGNFTLIREEIYSMNSITFLESLWQDIRYSLRTLAKARVFTFVVIASLALGIGANTAIFSLINAALLKMLPVRDPRQLVQLKSASPASGLSERFSYADFKEFRDRNRVFSGVLAFYELFFDVNIEVNGQGGVARGQVVSGDYFSVLGINPAIGRMIAPTDETVAGQSPVAVISYDYWRRRFALDPGVVGEKIVLNNSPYTIIGVTPPEFFGLQPGEKIDISVPITMIGRMNPGLAQSGTRYDILNAPFNDWLYVMARLGHGVTFKEASANLEPIFRESMRKAAEGLSGTPYDSPANRRGFLQSKLQLDSAGEGLAALRQQFATPLWILMGIVGLLLLVTCANVANLLLARANSRQKEIAVRLAMGAGLWRMTRQLLTESVLLALGGGALGLLLAFWGSKSLLTMMSHSDSVTSLSVQPDAAVLSFTLLISLLTALLFGLVPAWRAARLNSASALVESIRTYGRARSRSRLGKALIISQMALSLVLLIGAGLLTRSLENLKNFYPGFHKENVLLFTIHPMTVGYNDARAALLFKDLLDKINGIPGVRSATFSFYSPLGVFGGTTPKTEEATPQSGKEMKGVGIDVVGPNYFKTLQTPVLSGRDFTGADQAGAPRVAVINEAMARDYFGDANPIGRHVNAPGWDTSWFEIVGVVQDMKTHSLREQSTPMIYLPLYQAPEGLATFEVRTLTTPLSVSNAIRKVIKAIDSRVPIYDIKTLDEQVDDSLVQERLVASLSSLFGLLALILAAVGLYGLMTYAVNRRTGEIGIRMALGATREQIAGMILRETLQLVLIGLGIGIPAAIAAARLIKAELYGLKSDDPITLVITISIMAGVAVCAAWLPARRASRVEPMVALRTE